MFGEIAGKERVAGALAMRVKDGDVIGVGSGSTVEIAVKKIGERISNEGIRVSAVPSSFRIAEIAADHGFSVLHTNTRVPLTWAFDGADEVDANFNLIKGGGGAMLGEKIIACRARGKLVIIVTQDKLVDRLGERFAVPVEVVPEAKFYVMEELKKLGSIQVIERSSSSKYGPAISEHGNVLLDARFDFIHSTYEMDIKKITGVVENGLFFGYAGEVLVASKDGVFSLST